MAMSWKVAVFPLLVSNALLFAQQAKDELYFKHYSVEEGLSQNSVNCVLKSADASLWIGTDDGLNHFDGHSFVIYRNRANNPNNLSNNEVKALAWDSLNNLWIATASGLNRYNPYTETFTVFKDSSSSFFSDLLKQPLLSPCHRRQCLDRQRLK